MLSTFWKGTRGLVGNAWPGLHSNAGHGLHCRDDLGARGRSNWFTNRTAFGLDHLKGNTHGVLSSHERALQGLRRLCLTDLGTDELADGLLICRI